MRSSFFSFFSYKLMYITGVYLFMMNAESTPLRTKLKVEKCGFPLSQGSNELTPIRESYEEERKKYCPKRADSKITGSEESEIQSDDEPMIRSQVFRSYKKRKTRESKIRKKSFSAQNGSSDSSEDIINETGQVNVSLSFNSSKGRFLDSGIDKLLINVPCDFERNCDVFSNHSKSKLCENELSSEGLSVSDVMKWNDISLLPQENESCFSNVIKRKLFENALNENVIKSQTSGWSQCDFSGSKFHVSNNPETFYGLPSRVRELYKEHKGISELYSWQEDCLNLEAVKQKKNLVFSLPTSGGKSLVAEILILQEILIHHKNVLFILPFVSIVQEKIRDFSHFALEFSFALEEYAAGKGAIPPKRHRKKNSLMIATIEKGLIVVSSLLETNRLEEVGLVVVDELHFLLEEGRGPTLEMLLIQLLHYSGKMQIIGMTATIGNLEEVAKFLRAESYAGNFRPLRLLEYIKCGSQIFSVNLTSQELFQEVRVLDAPCEDTDGIAQLIQEVMPGQSVLVFCPTKKNCENVATLLCQVLPRNLTKFKEAEKGSLFRALISETNEKVCPILKQALPFGVAYHHSGLTVGERKLLEEAFRQGTISVICCTSTLAVGVNLPARRVILRSPYVGKDFISLSKYKQMVGRAGRAGFGSEGDSFLICQAFDLEKVENLFRSQMDEVTSKMDSDNCENLILSSIGLKIATTKDALKNLLSCSLLHNQNSKDQREKTKTSKLFIKRFINKSVCSSKAFTNELIAHPPESAMSHRRRIFETPVLTPVGWCSKLNKETGKIVEHSIDNLLKKGALIIKNKEAELEKLSERNESESLPKGREKCMKISDDCNLIVSRLGRAAVKGGFSLEVAHELYKELVRAQERLVLLTNLHLLYLVTPYDFMTQIKPNFSIFFNVYMRLNAKDCHAARAIGITECVVSKLAVGCKPKNTKDATLSRFYLSLILYELWNQRTVWDVAQLFQLPRGLVQTLMTSAASFVNSVLRFCEEFEEFWPFKSLLSDFAPRLAHCCAPELLPLMDLPAVKRGRAKQLYDAGFKTLQTIAVAQPAELVRSLDHMPYGVASQIVAAAKLLLMEKVESLREEAEIVLEGLGEKFPSLVSQI